MNRIIFIIICIGLVSSLFLSCNTEQGTEQSQTKPNFLFLFADDLTYRAINALGNEEIRTPNIDQIAKNGTVFTHAFNMGGWNGAICVASRAMIISGRSIWKAKSFKESWKNKDSTSFEMTWPKLLSSNGYDTYFSGKWHVDAPADSVFHTVRHIRPGMPKDHWNGKDVKSIQAKMKDPNANFEDIARALRPKGYFRPLDINDRSWESSDTSNGGFWQGGLHWSEVLKNDAIDYINMASADKDPFFMYLAFNAPHDPRQAPQDFVDMYDTDSISLPKSWLPVNPYKDDIGNTMTLRDEALAPFPRTKYATKVHIKEYYAIITHLDQQIGEIVSALKASGKMDNTYIIFTADHGLAVGRHGFIGKQSLYDHSIRPPFMISGPNIPADHKIESDIYLQDIMPTTLELAGMTVPDYVDFKSLLPLLNKGDSKHYDGIYGAYVGFQRMIRKNAYKLIVYPKIDKILLYNMDEDPEETVNLADHEDQKDRVAEMLNELIAKQSSFEDELDLSYLLKEI